MMTRALAHASTHGPLRLRQIGQHRLVRRVGWGAMGVVFHAHDDALDRPVAIKLCREHTADARHRFDREARVLARLDHPNIPAVHHRGLSDDGCPYLVMDLLSGANLHQIVSHDGPQPAARVANVLLQLARALEAVHAQGLVHRDIKPGNVLLTCATGASDLVKLIDFGLVFDMHRDEPEEARVPCGTMGYVAPEVWNPHWPLDGRADLYGVGAVGHFLLLGEHFDGNDEELIAYAREHSAPAPRSLAALIHWCLADDPRDRPESARELALELREVAKLAPWHPKLAEQWWVSQVGDWEPAAGDGTLVEPPAWFWR